MAQYQSGSQIPFSRNAEGLIEIRMNPSIYPVASSTWKLLQSLLPEVKSSYFTMTINRERVDFGRDDEDLITLLHGLGNLRYAAFYPTVPPIQTPQQVNFGDRYLGQTVRVENGRFNITGYWGAARGEKGQLNICTGYGDLFPSLALYLSMVVAEPSLLPTSVVNDIKKATTLSKAIDMRRDIIWPIFEATNTSILNNPRLYYAVQLGERIMEELSFDEVEI